MTIRKRKCLLVFKIEKNKKNEKDGEAQDYEGGKCRQGREFWGEVRGQNLRTEKKKEKEFVYSLYIYSDILVRENNRKFSRETADFRT